MKGVIQVGAHYAEEFEGWLSLGVENFMFFEPVLSNYNKMVQILPKSPKIKTYRMALGNMKGKGIMNTETVHQGKSCSLLKPLLHLQQYPDILFSGVEYVNIDKLDNISYNRFDFDHLHIDVQGYEMEVLKGAADSLEYFKTVETEVHRAELFEGCGRFEDVCALMFKKGYSLESVWWRGNTWGDAKFVRLAKI